MKENHQIKQNKTKPILTHTQTNNNKNSFFFLLKHRPYFCNHLQKLWNRKHHTQEFKKIKREQSINTSQMPLTRYPKKNPDEQMRNCCHLGLSESEIPNKLRACSSFFICSSTPLSPTQISIQQKVQFFGTQTINQPRNLALACWLCQPQKKKNKEIEFWLHKMQNLVD